MYTESEEIWSTKIQEETSPTYLHISVEKVTFLDTFFIVPILVINWIQCIEQLFFKLEIKWRSIDINFIGF